MDLSPTGTSCIMIMLSILMYRNLNDWRLCRIIRLVRLSALSSRVYLRLSLSTRTIGRYCTVKVMTSYMLAYIAILCPHSGTSALISSILMFSR